MTPPIRLTLRALAACAVVATMCLVLRFLVETAAISYLLLTEAWSKTPLALLVIVPLVALMWGVIACFARLGSFMVEFGRAPRA